MYSPGKVVCLLKRSVMRNLQNSQPHSHVNAQASRALTTLALATFIFVASPALCDDRVTLELTGIRDASCGVSMSSAKVDLGRVDLAGSATVSFSIACNAPFAYGLVSQHGALTHDGEDAEAKVRYRVTTSLQTTDGAPISDSCESAALKDEARGCAFSTSGDAIAVSEPAHVSIVWDGAKDMLPAGIYRDELIFTLYPRT